MTLIDVALVTPLGLIATGLWWLGAHLQERERRKTERDVHSYRLEESDRRAYLRERNIYLETIHHGQRLEAQGKAIMDLADEIREDDPREPWRDGGH